MQSIKEEQVDHLVRTLVTFDPCSSILVVGVGTSGVVAQKIVHALRCQQYPAHLLSPGDALHGASGVIQKDDLMIVISNGGMSETVNSSAIIAKDRGAVIYAVTSQEDSILATIADYLLLVEVNRESDYSGILATASILCVIALFDAIISILEEKRHFTIEKFSHIHPSGKVGKDILLDR
ncbi:MAG: SIS domain-containing protein [Sphaerochaetaceae bacterium]|nr:SIS domain-containing protein [Sphaerochaetaceae bacterium]